MLLSHLNNLLVARGAAVAQPCTMASMGDGALSVHRRPSEHHPVCHPRFLRSRALSVLRSNASPVRSHGASRPSRGRSHHVGSGRVHLRVSGGGLLPSIVFPSVPGIAPLCRLATRNTSLLTNRRRSAASFRCSPISCARNSAAKPAEMVWFVAVFVATGLCFSFLIATSSDDDDQALRLWKQSGPFSVAVFAPAGDLQAGPTSFGVLVQDRNTQEVLLDSAVDLSARPAAATSWRPATGPRNLRGLRQQAAANCGTGSAGRWRLDREPCV